MFISALHILLICLFGNCPRLVTSFGFENAGASCGSNEYCPAGWSVLRRSADYSAHTCNPAVKERSKCPKPYMCVAAKCGISFCCVSDKMLEKVREKESEERRMAEESEEEREEGKAAAINEDQQNGKQPIIKKEEGEGDQDEGRGRAKTNEGHAQQKDL